MDERHQRVEEIVGTALEIGDPMERATHLSRACAGNEILRREVEGLVQAHSEAGTFLEEPPPGATALQDGTQVPGTRPRASAQAGDRKRRFKLLEQIGEGGFGEVWLAEQDEPVHRRVALKVIKLGMDTKEVVARFEAERQALAILDHPNIARIFDGGATDSGRPYFVMELVRGVKITDYCDQAQFSRNNVWGFLSRSARQCSTRTKKGSSIGTSSRRTLLLAWMMRGCPCPRSLILELRRPWVAG